jgi:hypothetical protein
MKTQNIYDGVSRTIYLIVDGGLGHCEICQEPFSFRDIDISKSINHYIEKHNYRLLHVGQEDLKNDDGVYVHHTVAIVGG